MSTYWDIYCVDCESHCGFNLNHGDDTLSQVLLGRQGFKVLYDSGTFQNLWAATPEASGWPSMCELGEFFSTHHEHNLRVRSEYGEYLHACNKDIHCPTCDYPKWNCSKQPGHDGPCEKK